MIDVDLPGLSDQFVEALRQKGGSGAKLFYAQAVALQKQGNLKLARASYKAAMDTYNTSIDGVRASQDC